MIKKICLGVIRFEIGGLQGKLWRFREVGLGPNHLLKILLIKIFSNDSDFVFTFQYMKFWTKSLYMVEKILLAKKKTITKNFEKKNFFSKSLLRGDGGGTFCLHIRNLQKIWW